MAIATPAFDALPPHIREKATDMLIANKSSRDVSAYLLQQGHTLSHAAIARYKSRKVNKALETGAKLQKLNAAPASASEQARDIAVLTKEALAAEPILSRINWAWSEVEQGVEETRAQRVTDGDKIRYIEPDVKARASMLNVARGLIETQAKAMMHPGFTPAAQQAVSNTLVQIAVHAPHQAEPEVDVQVIEIKRS